MGALVLEPPQGRERGPDAEVVGDRPGVVERDVEVGPHEDPLPVEGRQVLEQREPHEWLAAPTMTARSTSRLE